MTFNALIVVAGLTAVLFFIAAVRNRSGRRIAGGLLKGSVSAVLFLVAVCAVLVSANLRTYHGGRCSLRDQRLTKRPDCSARQSIGHRRSR
jgi:hypothetical protein